jgi:hypothetical protein
MNRILTITSLFDYINRWYPNLLFWDGYSKHEPRNSKKSYKHRAGMPNEIRIEFDGEDKTENWINSHETCINLIQKGFSFAIFYVEGGRSPHIHLYDCEELSTLQYDERTYYRKKFLQKYCPKNSKVDFNLCEEKHLMALEFVNHFKYNKPKRLLYLFDNGALANQCLDIDIWFEYIYGIDLKQNNTESKLKFNCINPRIKTLMNYLSFEKVFDRYNVKYKGKMALCPFHNDSNLSLSFSNEKGLWNCFGCEAKGDVIKLIQMLEKRGDLNGVKE